MKRNSYLGIFSRLLLNASLFLCVSCGGGGSIVGGEEKQPEQFRIINAAYRASEVRVFLGEAPIEKVVSYGEESGYFEVPEGTVSARVVKEDEVLAQIKEDLTIKAGGTFTYLVTQDADNVLMTSLLTDDAVSPKGGLFKLRFINAGLSETVDFHLTLPGDDAEPPATAPAIAFKAASEYLEFDPGELNLHVTAVDASKDLVESDTFSFEAGRIYTAVFIEDEGGGKPYHILVLTDK